MMASEEEELSERLQDETPSGSELEGMLCWDIHKCLTIKFDSELINHV